MLGFRRYTSLGLVLLLATACAGASGADSSAAAEDAAGGTTSTGTTKAGGPTAIDDGEAGAASAPAEREGNAAAGRNGSPEDEAVAGAGTDTVTDDRSSSGDGNADGIDDGHEDDPPRPITPQDWMNAVPGLGEKSLNAIFLPATHDSGTYKIVPPLARPIDDVFAPDDGENAVIRLGEFAGISQEWAKAQNKTVLEQLNDGVRAIDLRPCAEKDGTLRVCHSLYGAPMSEILADIRTFADAHPHEFVLVSLAGFAGMNDAHQLALVSEIKQRLGSHLLNAAKGEVAPSTTLNDVWKTGKSLAVQYDDNEAYRDPSFLSTSKIRSAYDGEKWKRDETRERLVDAIEGKVSSSRFLWFSSQATPNKDLLMRSLDPLGNYPKSLEELAAATNPVVLGWIKNDWASHPLNILAVDFYENSCVVPLAQLLNGGSVSLDGCSIGNDTNWDKWALVSYGRGAGVPMVCAAGEQSMAGLCYSACQPGYSANVGFPYLCQAPCPAGTRDDGLTCFRDAQIISANTKSCPWYNKCGVGSSCNKCPDGWENDGCTCRINPQASSKSNYNRGVGHLANSCPAGTEQSGLLCYPACRDGYSGVGPLCVPQ